MKMLFCLVGSLTAIFVTEASARAGGSHRQVSVHPGVLSRFDRQVRLRDAERMGAECSEPDWCFIAVLDRLVFAASHVARGLE